MNDRIETVTNSAEDEALQWLVDLDGLSPEEQERCTAWLGERPENRAAFEKLERQWRNLDVVRQLETETLDTNIVHKWLWQRRRHRQFLPMSAAAIAVLAVGVWVSFPTVYEAQYQTAIGQQNEIVLPDDSVITLNTNSEITVRYDGEERRVELTRGEAHFLVAPALDRPFSVLAGAGLVRAVGTAFNVHLMDEVVTVTVTEGVVEVLPSAPAVYTSESPNLTSQDSAPIAETVAQGHQLEYRDTIGFISDVPPKELARLAAWREGWLEFENESLAYVIEQASRYFSTRITIEDPELAGMPVTATFETGDVDSLIRLIETNDGIRVRRISPRDVQIISTKPLNQ